MNKPDAAHVVEVSALILALIALAGAVLLLIPAPASRSAVRSYQAMDARLLPLEAEARRLDTLALALDHPGTPDPKARLRDLLGPDIQATFSVNRTASPGPVQVHAVIADVPDADYSTLVSRIQAGETSSPPLTLMALELEPASGQKGRGRARLTFECLEWRPAAGEIP